MPHSNLIRPASEFSTDINMLIYGPPGHGKTRFVGSAQDDPRTSPILVVAFEKGIRTLSHRADIDVARVEEPADLNEIRDVLTDPKCKYKSVAVDSLSEVYQLYLLKEIADQARSRPNRREDVAEIQDYAHIAIVMRRLIRWYRDLPMVSIFTALAETRQDSTTNVISTRPLCGGQKLPDELPALLNCIFYLGIAEEEDGSITRVLITAPRPRLMARVHQPENMKLPEEIENPTMTKVLDAMGVPYPGGGTSRKPVKPTPRKAISKKGKR